ncbi:hypothetical protein GCM10009617_00220 [Leifsonia poae]|uniref:Uncharacterized protein n=1 Tax=Leifsonia poae TaxID=110933 RepID=A0A9W6H5V7_9MICO|nr:hypothetical protein GCM10017584_00220 [Leifsonia poae]
MASSGEAATGAGVAVTVAVAVAVTVTVGAGDGDAAGDPAHPASDRPATITAAPATLRMMMETRCLMASPELELVHEEVRSVQHCRV